MRNQQVPLFGYTDAATERFNKRVGNLVHAQNQRFKKLKLAARFDLRVGREIMAASVGKPCRYCSEQITINNVSPDHPTPIARGGDPLDIVPCCERCNRRKGELTSDEYFSLLVFIRSLSPEAQEYLFRVLSSGPAYFKMRLAVIGAKKELQTLKQAAAK